MDYTTLSQEQLDAMPKDQVIAITLELQEQNHQLVSILKREDVIFSNPNQSPSDKAISAAILRKHPTEVLNGTPFVINVGAITSACSVDPKTTTTYFAAMRMAGGLEFTDENPTPKVTVKTVTYDPNSFDVVDTKSTDIKNKIREEEAKRKKAKIEKIEQVTCPTCHSSEHVMMSNQSICATCSTVIDATELFPQKELYRHIEPVEEVPLTDNEVDNPFSDEPVKETPVHEYVEEACMDCGLTEKRFPAIFPLQDGFCRFCFDKRRAQAS